MRSTHHKHDDPFALPAVPLDFSAKGLPSFKLNSEVADLTSQIMRSAQIFPKGVSERLSEYESFFGFKSGTLAANYGRSPIHYSLDSCLAVSSDFVRVAYELGGVLASSSGTSKLFGLEFVHGGVILKQDVRAKGPQKRTTIYTIDPLAMKSLTPERFSEAIDILVTLTDQSNHDPLHGVNGDPKHFRAYDGHLRYGGVEFVPILVHAEFVRDQLSRYPVKLHLLERKAVEFCDLIETIETNAGAQANINAKLYFCSIYIRHLLLVLPQSHAQVQGFLALAQDRVFRNQTLVAKPDGFRAMLHRDFSEADHQDPMPERHPAHTNRTRLYEHGRHSGLRPYLNEKFRATFDIDCDKTPMITYGEYLLLETLRRGHGIFSCVSAHCEADLGIKSEDMRRIFLGI